MPVRGSDCMAGRGNAGAFCNAVRPNAAAGPERDAADWCAAKQRRGAASRSYVLPPSRGQLLPAMAQQEDEATAAFLASIDVVSLEFRRLVVELQRADGATGRNREDLRALVAPMTRALRDMVAHAEAEGQADRTQAPGARRGERDEPQPKRRRTAAATTDVVGTGLGSFARERSLLFPSPAVDRPAAADEPAAGAATDSAEQLQRVLQRLDRYQLRAFPPGSAPRLKFERPRRAGSRTTLLHAECPGVCTWTITLALQSAGADTAAGCRLLRVDNICAAGLDEARSYDKWFDDPARRAWYRSRHSVFASLSDGAMDAAAHYASVYPSEPVRAVLQTLIWLAHTSTVFQEPCMVCGQILSWGGGGGGAGPTPPTCRHFDSFRALHTHCRWK